MMALNWKYLENLEEKLKDQFDSDTILVLEVQFYKLPPSKRKTKLVNFLNTMWNIYDDNRSIIKLVISTQLDKKILYSFEQSKCDESRLPKTGNPTIVTNWRKYTSNKKETLLKVLEKQILEGIK